MKTKRWKKLYGHTVSFVCPYCLKTLPLAEATKDHKNPYGRFYDNSPENIVLCCRKDNEKKGMLTAEEYMLFMVLDRVRKGQKNERDLEILREFERELLCVFSWKNKNCGQNNKTR